MITNDKTLTELQQTTNFTHRHTGSDATNINSMLSTLGITSLEGLIEQTVPSSIRLTEPLNIDKSLTEIAALSKLEALAKRNKVYKSYIGMGYHNTHVPAVILRNLLENPGWYTSYTPYQPEISQGRLEALLNFQQMVMDLTGMELANASLLDEATAAAEAMTLCKRSNRKKTNTFFISNNVHPQTIEVIKTRAEYFGYQLVVGDPVTDMEAADPFGALIQYTSTYGDIEDIESIIKLAKQQNIMTVIAADILSLVLLKSPGELGADVVLGSSQRFGVPMGFGGPHAAFFATGEKLKRSVPGRVIGVSVDTRGNTALRLAMQTREQHIRREKATSNICTAQALLANMAGFYAIYHGPEGLKTIAERVHRSTAILANGLKNKGIELNDSYFDTLTINLPATADKVYQRALAAGCNLRKIDKDHLGISLDETTTPEDITQLLDIILGEDHGLSIEQLDADIIAGTTTGIASSARRTDSILTHSVFNSYHSETQLMRYMKKLENKDYSLVHGMIPLGSCTMKLNATAEMIPVTWREFADIHPFAPRDQVQGYIQMLHELESQLEEITGYDKISLQPNSGASGEYAGLLVIRKYQESIGQGHRNICLIPSSAHGTNPASAAMMGMKIIVTACDENGNVDINDLREKAEANKDNLSALMITYPSTHGVYEEDIVEICELIHQNGGQVYMDGANMNAQVGIAKPGNMGSDVSHLNLHKTFAIPHGGGGPGMGPIGVKAHLAPFLASHKVCPVDELPSTNGSVSAAPYGSASILPITWMYNLMLGNTGLKLSTEIAILNTNYIAEKLSKYYPILYRGRNNKVAHECILDIRPFKEETGISEEDVAKRLMDYGFHAPTMSFPVAGTLMVEPTESESREELDRFIQAMIQIHEEIIKVQQGTWPTDNNPLCNAPHTQADIVDSNWNRPYSREEAVFPNKITKQNKFWPAVNRVDNVHGDRNFICSCPSIDAYAED